jgi:hypothetical protein
MSSSTLADVFKHAIEDELAFEDGRNFKDVVILLSAVERVRSHSGDIGIMISDDGVFQRQEPKIAKYCSRANIDFRCWKLKDAETNLTGMLGAVLQARLQQHRELATKALMTALPLVQEHFNQMLDHVARLESSRLTLRRVERDARFESVTDVDVPALDEEPLPGSEVGISGYFEGTVQEVHLVGGLNPISEMPGARKLVKVGAAARANWDGTSYHVTPKINLSY